MNRDQPGLVQHMEQRLQDVHGISTLEVHVSTAEKSEQNALSLGEAFHNFDAQGAQLQGRAWHQPQHDIKEATSHVTTEAEPAATSTCSSKCQKHRPGEFTCSNLTLSDSLSLKTYKGRVCKIEGA